MSDVVFSRTSGTLIDQCVLLASEPCLQPFSLLLFYTYLYGCTCCSAHGEVGGQLVGVYSLRSCDPGAYIQGLQLGSKHH